MMHFFLLHLKSFSLRIKRTFLYLAAIALLCFIAGLLATALFEKGPVEPVHIILVDEDETFESGVFYTLISEMESYKKYVTFEKKNRTEAINKLAAGEADGVFIIPENFTQNVMNGQNEPYEVVYNRQAPLKTGMIEYFSEAFVELLKYSQIGVYTALDYTNQQGDRDQQDKMFRNINLRYISMVLNREEMVQLTEETVTGSVDIFAYYFIAVYVFIILAGVILYTDVMQSHFNKTVLVFLRKANKLAPFYLVVSGIGAFFLYFCLMHGVLGLVYGCIKMIFGLEFILGRQFILYLPVFLLCVSAFGIWVSLQFSNTFQTGLFVSLFSVCSLFLAGGIVPLAYFSPLWKLLGKCTFHYWAMAYLQTGYLSGPFNVSAVMLFIFCCIFFLLALLAAYRKSKVGEIL